MGVGEQGSVQWSSIRAWEGLKQNAFRAFCVEWIRHEVVADEARCVESPGNDQGIGIHWVLKNGAEYRWLLCDDVEYFGIRESRALTARVMQYLTIHPQTIHLTLALPFPLAVRISTDHLEEQREWTALLTRCEYLMRTQGRIILFSYWDVSAWEGEWSRLKQNGTLALWFASAPLGTDWLEAQTERTVSLLPWEIGSTQEGRANTHLWLEAWFRDAPYYQKITQLRRKFQRMAHQMSLFSFPDAKVVHEEVKRVMEALWLQPMNQVGAWDHHRLTSSLERLRNQVTQALISYERVSTDAEKDRKKNLLHWMRLLTETRQFMDQPHWRVFHMPYILTSNHSVEEVQEFELMMIRGMQRKYPLLALWDEGSALESFETWIGSTLGISCPTNVLWETLHDFAEQMDTSVYLVIISRATYTEREWQNRLSELTTQWMKYPRLSCWIHRLSS